MKLKNGYQEFYEYLEKKGLNETTLKRYKRILFGSLSHCGIKDKKISKLRLVDIPSVVESGKKHGEYGPTDTAICLRQYLKYLKEKGIKIFFDWRDISVPKVSQKPVEWLSEKELEKLLRSFNIKTLTGLRERALCEVLYSTGLRIHEALSLDIKDIDFEKREAVVKGKGEEYGKVYFTKRSLRWLGRYLKKRKSNHPALFVNSTGKGRIKEVTCRSYLNKYSKGLGFRQHICHHIFRRTFATHLIQRGAQIKEVQYLCRHKSERTTLRAYLGVDKARAKEVHQRILGGVENCS